MSQILQQKSGKDYNSIPVNESEMQFVGEFLLPLA